MYNILKVAVVLKISNFELFAILPFKKHLETMTTPFEKPKFQNIIQYYLNSNCDMESQVKALRKFDTIKTEDLLLNDANKDLDVNGNHKSSGLESRRAQLLPSLRKPMRVIILDMIPSILVSDGFNYMEAEFTKESIYVFRKNFSHQKFSSLKDKVIYLSQWTLNVDYVDSRKEFNSHNNFTIKIVIESFTPVHHQHVSSRVSVTGKSIFREEKIQILVNNFRHWFQQQTISQSSCALQDTLSTSESSADQLPSMSDVLFGPQPKKGKGRNKNQIVQTIDPNPGKTISETQVFRMGSNATQDFKIEGDVKMDSFEDIPQFKEQILQRKKLQTKDIRVYNVEQFIIQEQGERFFKENRDRKIRAQLDQIEDENHRNQLKMKIEYFQIDNSSNLNDVKHFETRWEHDERERAERKVQHKNQRRIVSYTFSMPIEHTKAQVIKLLNCNNKEGTEKQQKTGSPLKGGRPRANSQENILQIDDHNDKTNFQENSLMAAPRGYNREPLTQFVCHPNQDFTNNSDTQSEDSLDENTKKQIKMEKEVKGKKDDVEDEVTRQLNALTDKMAPMGISLYKQYLDWFTQNELVRIKPIEVSTEKGTESARPLESENTTKAESMIKQTIQDSPRFNIEDDHMEQDREEQDKVHEDQEMTESIKDSISEEPKESPEKIKPREFKISTEGSQEEVVKKQIQDINMEISKEERSKQPTEPSVSSNQNESNQVAHSLRSQPLAVNTQVKDSEEHEMSENSEDQEMPEEESEEEPNLDVQSIMDKLTLLQSGKYNNIQTMDETIQQMQDLMTEMRKAKAHLKIIEEKKLEKEIIEAASLEKERLEQLEKLRRQEEQRIAREKKEREEVERLNREKKEREEREEAERQAHVKREREEAERIVLEKKQREEAERIEREKQAKLEKEKVEKLQKEQALRELEQTKLREKQEREKQEVNKHQKMERERQEQIKREKIQRERQEHEKRQKMEVLRIQKEKKEKEKEEKDRLEREEVHRQEQASLDKQRLEEEQEQVKAERYADLHGRLIQMHEGDIDDIIAAKAAELLLLQKDNQVAPVQEEAEDDWQEGSPVNSSQTQSLKSEGSFQAKKIEDEVENRKAYAQNMGQSFGKELDQEINKRSGEDLKRRDFHVKNLNNSDEFIHDIKHVNEKFKDVKINKLIEGVNEETQVQQLMEQNDRLGQDNSQRFDVSEEGNIDKYLGNEQNEEESYSEDEDHHHQDSIHENQVIDISSSTEKDKDEVQVITAREMKMLQRADKEAQQKVPPMTQPAQVAAPQAVSISSGSQPTTLAVQPEIMTALMQQLTMLNEKVNNLQSQLNSQNANKQGPGSDEDEEDYHVPVFGSQAQTGAPEYANVKPFTEKPKLGQKRSFNQMSTEEDKMALEKYVEEQRLKKNKEELQKAHEERRRSRSSSPMKPHHSQQKQQMTREQYERMKEKQRREQSQSQERQQQRPPSQQIVNRPKVDQNGNPIPRSTNQYPSGSQPVKNGSNMGGGKRYMMSQSNPRSEKTSENINDDHLAKRRRVEE